MKTKLNLKKVTGKAMLSRVAIPLGFAMLGSMAGAAAGKTGNLVVAGALGAAGLAFDQPNLIFAGAGAVAITPSKAADSLKGLDGLDGFKETFLTAKNRALGQAKGLLSNAKLDFIGDKIPVAGLMGLGETDAFEIGYVQGVEDTVDEYGGSDVAGLEGGWNFGALPTGQRVSIEAMRMQSGM